MTQLRPLSPFRPFELNGKVVPGTAGMLVEQPTRWVFTSGQVALDDGELVGEGDFAAQAAQCMENIGRILEAAGAGWKDVVKLTTWVTDASNIPHWPGVRLRYIVEPYPASSTVVSQLVDPRYLIEVEAIAAF